MTPGTSVLVLGCGHISHIVKMHYLFKTQAIVGTHGWLRFVPLSITRGGSCKHQLGRMIIIKDDLIGNSWGSMSIFVQSERSFQRTFVSLFKMATLNDLVSCCDSEVVVMLPFLQKSLFLIQLIWLERKIKHYVSDGADVYMIPHLWWREERSVINRGFRRWCKSL